jgi:hypothetical protein
LRLRVLRKKVKTVFFEMIQKSDFRARQSHGRTQDIVGRLFMVILPVRMAFNFQKD